VDIEAVRPGFVAERIAEQCFAPAEVAELRSLPLAQQDAAFFACWTRKEAFVKALGQGLSYPLQRFQVSLAPGEEPHLVTVDSDRRARQHWSLLDLGCLPTHRAALVVEGNETSLTLLTPQDFPPEGRYISPRPVVWNGVWK
jgi:4'-phosphopantetheinyl transferase